MRIPHLFRGVAITALFGLLVGFRPVSPAPSVQLITEPQAGITPWLTAIQHARTGVDVNWYLLTDAPLIQALRADAARGVPVRVIIDGHPYDDATAVAHTEAAFHGSRVHLRLAPARFEQAYTFDHAKYLIINPGTDQAQALLGSPNGTASAFDGTNAEVAIDTTQPAVTTALTTVFHADWTDQRAGLSPRRTLVLSPGAQTRLVTLLRTPGPLAITTEELGDAAALYRAIQAHHAQARVLVPATLSSADRAQATALAHAGVQVRTLTTPYVHAKLIVTATATFVGSQNFSESSLNANREVGLITPQPTIHRQALAWFNHLWQHATPWSSTPASTAPSQSAYPYLPDGDTPAQVRAAWGPPRQITHDTYQGQPQVVWMYPGGRVYFSQDRVVDVQRSS